MTARPQHLYIYCLFQLELVDLSSTMKEEQTHQNEQENDKEVMSPNANTVGDAEKEGALSAQLEILQIQHAELKGQYEELYAAAKQIAADFDNYRKRVMTEKERDSQDATRKTITKLLPILDYFALCLENAAHHEEFVKAVQLLYSQLLTTLEDLGVKQVSALHQKFDPKYHEAIMFVADEKEEGIIVEEIQKGYLLNDMLIRASKVKVTKQVEG